MTTVYYLLQQRLIKQGKLPSAFKVQITPTKKKQSKANHLESSAKDQENRRINGKHEKRTDSKVSGGN